MKNNEIDVLAINESRMDNSIAPELITIHSIFEQVYLFD
jgi:hypothetical protein